ncbi:hypothetical protein K2Z83_20685 [Oscillochloris sp. ZM17-4]|uniref:hypothetical protein n=1 Tax=Oscillochloris sp. ZM17-4 TaxID=2866714 RepID=UPI001C734CC2|nr:hypothetical protein [Oscillochloris sp. ZM17-4]MBX0330088.1 hypothetical protein [Oscillochloris sp. ZM17-4]
MSPINATLIVIIIAAGGVLTIYARRRPRVTAEVRAALVATLLAYPDIEAYRAYRVLSSSRDGLAVALLLLNAAAKSNAELYAHKVALLRAVVQASRRRDWWMQAHTHPDATGDTNTVAIFVETSIGPILDIPRVQLSAHISAENAAAYFAAAPSPRGRGWAGIALQPRAEEIARAFLAR